MKTVLVVDDDRITTAILGVWLKRQGHAVMVEHDVPDAIRVMKTRSVDAIIHDLDMPSGCGAEVIERLKVFHRTGAIPIIVISANRDPNTMERVLAIGADRFLVKPTSSENIAEALGLLFERQEKKAREKENHDVEAIRDRKPLPVVQYQKSTISLQSLVNLGSLHRMLRKSAH